MITSVKTRKGSEAITSDQWHVVHSRFTQAQVGAPFRRHVTSEHGDRAACVKAARELMANLRAASAGVPPDQQDEVFVCRPGFKSLRVARRRTSRRPRA
jgi:hypothetical protein